MTDPFDERQKAFEHQFSRDVEHTFRLESRAAKACALWAAQKMGLEGADALAYMETAITGDLDAPQHERLFDKIEADFGSLGIPLTRRQIERRYAILFAQTRQEMQDEEEAALAAELAREADI